MTFNEMQINSLEYIRILVCIEEEYGIVFSYEYYENFANESLEMLIEYIYEQIKRKKEGQDYEIDKEKYYKLCLTF